MKVAVITPYFQEPQHWIERCVASVRVQTHPCTHFMMSDGQPLDALDQAGVRHVRLGRAHADYGNTPRAIGAQLAVAEGFDAIAFLDADNWFDTDHVEICIEAAMRSNADVVIAKRRMVRADGSHMPVVICDDADGSHVDTNCFFLQFGAFHTLARWLLMPKPMAMWADRFYLASLREEGLSEVLTSRTTVNYLCTWANVFRSIGEEPPAYAKAGLPVQQFADWLGRLQPSDLEQVRRLSGCCIDKALRPARPT
mgnify:CR=1 FL=1